MLVPGRILGVLRETSETQGIGLLIEVPNAPVGLGTGARLSVSLTSGARSGFLLPRAAIIYDENGAYAFKRSERKTQKTVGKTSFVPVKVKLLAAAGDDWLTEGLDDDDEVVVQGAGVLWSLQGMAGQAPDDDDD
jgi:tetrahydromethanopterin S-methyltransferase subunit H